MRKESIDSYIVALHFFSQIFLSVPDEKIFQSIIEQNLFESFLHWECFDAPIPSSDCKKIEPSRSINKLLDTYSMNSDKNNYLSEFVAIRSDHLTLFSGPNPISPPWESVWREKAQLLFGIQTQKVAKLYYDFGVAIINENREPEDHLGYELSFVCFLLQLVYSTSAPLEDREVAQSTLKYFLEEHVMLWAGDCLEKASHSAKTIFYSEATKLCWVLLVNLHEHIVTHGECAFTK